MYIMIYYGLFPQYFLLAFLHIYLLSCHINIRHFAIKLEIKLHIQKKAREQCLRLDGTCTLPCFILHFSFLVHTMHVGYLNSHFSQTIWICQSWGGGQCVKELTIHVRTTTIL